MEWMDDGENLRAMQRGSSQRMQCALYSIGSLLEAVSARAVELGVLNCKGVAALLARKPDNTAAKDSRAATLFDHANLRGPGYYH
jgi:hypothetical protein